MTRPQFANNEIYHIYNRGVEERNVFMDKSDYFRFVHDLFEFNDTNPAIEFYYKAPFLTFYQSSEVEPQRIDFQKITKTQREPRKLLVEILAWCLMPNHYHLLVRQLRKDGVVRVMQKLGTGYTMYFNQKNERSGVLFQGRFKAVLVRSEEHLFYLPLYIHSNHLDSIEPSWREGKIYNYQKAMKSLESFRFSSHLDYLGKKNFPSVSQREFLLDIFGGTEGYKKEYRNWLKEMSKEKLEEIEDITLELEK